MGVPAHEDIDIELSLHGGESLEVTPGNDLVAVDEADAEVADLDNLCLGECRHVDVKVALDGVHLGLGRSQVLEPLEGLEAGW